MLAIREPIGHFITAAHIDKNIFLQKSIKNDVNNLVDLLMLRVKTQPIEKVSESLLEEMFDLRIAAVHWLANNNKDFSFVLEIINDYLAVNLQLSPYSDLANTISKVTFAFEEIIAPIVSNFPTSPKEFSQEIQDENPQYSMFKAFTRHPAPKIQSLKNWVDASLQFEIGLILSDLVLTDQLKLSKKRIKNELIEFLYDSITRFGAYSIFTDLWTPHPDDSSPLTNRIQILASAIALDNGFGQRISQKAFLQLLNN